MKLPLSTWHCLGHLMGNRNWLKHHHPPQIGRDSYQRRVSDRALIWFHLLFGHCSNIDPNIDGRGCRIRTDWKCFVELFWFFEIYLEPDQDEYIKKSAINLRHITTMFRFQLFLVYGIFINKLVRPYSAYLFLVNKTFFFFIHFGRWCSRIFFSNRMKISYANLYIQWTWNLHIFISETGRARNTNVWLSTGRRLCLCSFILWCFLSVQTVRKIKTEKHPKYSANIFETNTNLWRRLNHFCNACALRSGMVEWVSGFSALRIYQIFTNNGEYLRNFIYLAFIWV